MTGYDRIAAHLTPPLRELGRAVVHLNHAADRLGYMNRPTDQSVHWDGAAATDARAATTLLRSVVRAGGEPGRIARSAVDAIGAPTASAGDVRAASHRLESDAVALLDSGVVAARQAAIAADAELDVARRTADLDSWTSGASLHRDVGQRLARSTTMLSSPDDRAFLDRVRGRFAPVALPSAAQLGSLDVEARAAALRRGYLDVGASHFDVYDVYNKLRSALTSPATSAAHPIAKDQT